MKPTLTLIWGAPASRAKAQRTRSRKISVAVNGAACGLSPDAVPIWLAVKAELVSLGLWSTTDTYPLSQYAEYVAEQQRLQAKVRKFKSPYEKLTSNKGKIYYSKRPECSRLEYLDRELARLRNDLCLSPRARRIAFRATASTKSPDTDDDSYYRNRG